MKKIRSLISFLFILVFSIMSVISADACTGLGASGSATADGGTIVIKVRDSYPLGLQWIEVVSPTEGYKYVAIYVASSGCKGGINENGVSIGALNRRSSDGSKEGLSEHECTTMILEKSSDAKSAALLMKKIVEEQGRTDGSGGEGQLVGDPNEFWLFEETGHKFSSYGPIIDNVYATANFYQLADLRVYETEGSGFPRQARAESLLEEHKGSITLPLMIRFTRDQQMPSDRAFKNDGNIKGNICNEGYKSRTVSGLINVASKKCTNFISAAWYTLESPIASPYIPFYVGITEVPEEFGTTTAAETFAKLHLLLYENPEYRDLVLRVWENFEFREIIAALSIEKEVISLVGAGEEDKAHDLLNNFVKANCEESLKIANDLIEKITIESEWRIVK